MSTKFSKTVALLMIVALLTTFSASAVFAEGTTDKASDGLHTAASSTAGTVTLAPGQWQWYTFRSQVPVNIAEDDEAVVTDPTDATIDALLRTQTGTVDFEVWSEANLNQWLNGEDFDPAGAGTTNEALISEPLTWQGTFETNDTYYLVVRNRSSQAATYRLDITGNVSFPTQMAINPANQAAHNEVAQAQPAESTGEMALTVALPGESAMSDSTMLGKVASDVGTPALPMAGAVTLAPGQKQWYTFRSQVPVNIAEDDEAVVTDPTDATIDAVLRTQTGAVDFEVWSEADLNQWLNNEDFDPTGAGTKNEALIGEPLTWQGTFATNDTYYLVVSNRSSQAATYALDITGNVSFPAANTTAN